MSLQMLAVHDDRALQTLSGLRSLVLLGAACALFVAVAVLVAPASEAPIAAQVAAPEPAGAEPSLGA